MFGNDSQPTKNFTYGARAPVENLPLVREQMRLAHRYRNALVEQELKRRARVDEAIAGISPELQQVEKDLAAAEVAFEAADARAKAERKGHNMGKNADPSKPRVKGNRNAASPEARAAVKTTRAARAGLYARRKELRAALFDSERWTQEQETIDAWDNDERKKLRAGSGLYWGTYLTVEQSMGRARRGAPPRFVGWRGDGTLAVQLQKGLSVENLDGGDARIRMSIVEQKKRKAHALLRFRVSSDASEDPIFADVPVILHRPLPAATTMPNGKLATPYIKWAYLRVQRVATTERWSVRFAVSRESGWDPGDRASTGTVGIDGGWRMREDGRLRVAYWIGDDGQEGELCLRSGWCQQRRKVFSIRSIRDRNFNTARAALMEWRRDANVPGWFAEAVLHASAWRKPRRLASLAIRWRGERFEGDVEAFEAVEMWRKRDKHLYEYERQMEDQLQAERLDLYRNFAKQMRMSYRTAIVEGRSEPKADKRMDLRPFHEDRPSDQDQHQDAVKEHVRDAACSILYRCLKESMAEYEFRPAPKTTMTCPDCGTVEDFNRAPLEHTCGGCGRTEDQDRRAARNLLGPAIATGPMRTEPVGA